MKFSKFFLILLVASLSAIPAFAGSGTGSIISASSDCESVTVTYEITGNPAGTWDITSTGLAGIYDVPDVLGSATVTFPITSQLPGTAITIYLNIYGTDIDFAIINCSPSITGLVISDEGVSRINDGRVEPFPTDMVIYPLNDGIYIYSDEGEIILFIPFDTIEMIGIPDGDPRLLGETLDGYVQIYRMSDGRFQAVVGPDGEGKTHIVIWEGLGFVLFDTVENSSSQ